MKIQLEDLTKSFPGRGRNSSRVTAVKDFNFEIPDGELIGLLGPSGCGKSTTLNMICGLEKPTSGKIFFGDKDVTALPPEKRGVGMVFQNYALYPHLTVRQNIIFPLQNLKGKDKLSRAEMEKRAMDAAALVQIQELMERKPGELSGGQQQRVAIARALVTKPSIVLLDEPLCNLDVQLRIEMRTEMSYLFHKLKTTVFHVTHDPSEAFAMADRIIVMNGGKIDQADEPKNCYLKPKTALVAGLLGAGNDLKEVTLLEGNTSDCRIQVGQEQLEGMFFPSGDQTAKAPDRSLAELRFRPEDGHWLGEKAEGNCFKARSILSTFEGGCYRVKMEAGNGQEFCILHQNPIPEQAEGFVQVDKEKLYVYESLAG